MKVVEKLESHLREMSILLSRPYEIISGLEMTNHKRILPWLLMVEEPKTVLLVARGIMVNVGGAWVHVLYVDPWTIRSRIVHFVISRCKLQNEIKLRTKELDSSLREVKV